MQADPPTNSSRPPRWTPQQLDAITATGQSLLVSAAAGSGKTSVLAQRCVHMVCDAQPRCNVNQLLVVTFTELAAAEMKSRIEQAMRTRLEASPDDPHLRRQFALMDQASISTLHGFCHQLLRQNFHRVGLDPAFRVLDGDEAGLLRREVAHKLFLDRYDRDDAAAFCNLVDAFGEGEDERIINVVVRTYEMLRSLVNPRQWMKRATQRIDDAIKAPLEECELGREFLAVVELELDEIARECRATAATFRGVQGLRDYEAYANELAATVEGWRSALAERGYDGLANQVRSLTFRQLRSASSVPGGDEARDRVDATRELLKSDWLAKTLAFSQAQWQEGLVLIRPHVKVLMELLDEFAARYRRAKEEQRALDFSDLEHQTLTLLRDRSSTGLTPSAVARSLHKQYQHVLVDEYQDINEVQDAILALVSRECVATTGSATANLFCVGDVKQSIYAFRLAEAERFLRRQARFRTANSGGRVIDLQANFRSRAPLIDALNAVFQRLMTREAAEIQYDQSQHLVAGATFPPDPAGDCFKGAPIELHLLPGRLDAETDERSGEESEPVALDRAQREGLLIAQRIDQMMGEHGGAGAGTRALVIDPATGTPRPIEHRDIVILLRAMKHQAEHYADVLRRRGIPVHTASGTGFFESVEIRDMLALLRLLDNQRQDVPMAAILRSPLSGLASADDALARIRLAYRDSQTPVPFHEAVARYAREQTDETAAGLRAFLAELAEWRKLARQRPVADLIWLIYQRTGYLAFNSGLADGPQRCANLFQLYERARQFAAFSRHGIYRFIRFLESIGQQGDPPQASDQSAAENVVRIMSIHRAKGLEFPVVILPELGKGINFSDANGAIVADRHACLGMSAVDLDRSIRYPTLADTLVRYRRRGKTVAEELRILYVAMTRAREHLILVGTCGESAREKWEGRWAEHDGPLPRGTITSARTMLDWLGPVATTVAHADAPAIRITQHSSDEIFQWSQALDRRRAATVAPADIAQLKPLTPPPAVDSLAQSVINRLTRRYPYDSLSALAASRPVTSWTHGQAAASSTAAPPAEATAPAVEALDLPKCLKDDPALSATDRGTAVHLFLEHLDFSRPCSQEDLSQQLQSLVARRLMSLDQAAAADPETIRWLIQSPVGQLLQARAAELLRELPIVLPMHPSRLGALASDDPLDQVMIRGRIDLLVPDERGFILIDYKTDHVFGQQITQRRDQYRPQLELYREAIQRITGRPVHTAHLVFLTPRHIETL